MNMSYYKYFLLIILFFINACHQNKAKVNRELIKISEPRDTQIALSSIVSDFKIFPIDEEIGEIPYLPVKILSYKDSYYVLDRDGSEVAVHYDSNTFTSKVIGNSGRGPGEYLKPDDMYLNRSENELILLDRTQQKLIYYSLNDLRVLREETFSFSASRFIKDGKFYYFLGPHPGNRIIVTDHDLSIVNKFIDNDVRHHFKTINSSFYKSEDHIVYNTPYSPYFYTFQNGQLVDGRSIYFTSDNLTDEVFQSLPDFGGNYERFTNIAEDYKTNIAVLEETKRFIYFIYKYEQKTYVVLHDKKTGKSLNLPYTSFKNDLTFEKSVKILGSDDKGYFLTLVIMSDTQKKKLINSISNLDKNFEEAEAFIIRFKIDPQALNNL